MEMLSGLTRSDILTLMKSRATLKLFVWGKVSTGTTFTGMKGSPLNEKNNLYKTGNDRYSGERYSGNDGYSGPKTPDDAILFTISGITVIADKKLPFFM